MTRAFMIRGENMNSVDKAYKYRLYPNKKQVLEIKKSLEGAKFVYNKCLASKIMTFKKTKRILDFNSDIWYLRQMEREYTWLKEIAHSSLAASLKDLDIAVRYYLDGKQKFPKFKSGNNYRSTYRIVNRNNNIRLFKNHIEIPNLGMVRKRNRQKPEGVILSATIVLEASGKYNVILHCRGVKIKHLPKTNKAVGLDVGLKNFAVTDKGIRIVNPMYYEESLEKVAKIQRSMSRKIKGSSNWNKDRVRLAKLLEKVKNQRANYLHKLSRALVDSYDLICVESLNVKELMEHRVRSRKINDAAWANFIDKLEYKADWYGKKVVKVERWFASSQICSFCGTRVGKLKDLSIRRFYCPNCKHQIDRDVNAARNILREGMRSL